MLSQRITEAQGLGDEMGAEVGALILNTPCLVMFYELCPIFDSNFQISPRGNNCGYFAGHSRAAFSTYDYKWSLSS